MSETQETTITLLSNIAVDVYHSKHGSFLKALADTWLRADIENKKILQSAWVAIIKKYRLGDGQEN